MGNGLKSTDIPSSMYVLHAYLLKALELHCVWLLSKTFARRSDDKYSKKRFSTLDFNEYYMMLCLKNALWAARWVGQHILWILLAHPDLVDLRAAPIQLFELFLVNLKSTLSSDSIDSQKITTSFVFLINRVFWDRLLLLLVLLLLLWAWVSWWESSAVSSLLLSPPSLVISALAPTEGLWDQNSRLE